jgi:predicted HTH transcriptional regulator
VLNSSISDIDLNRFKAYYQRRFGNTPEERGLSVPQLLLNLKLVIKNEDGALLPTNLGILLFSEKPDKWLNGAFIDIAVYGHDIADGRTRDSRKISGPAPEQIEQALNYLMASPFFATASAKDSLGRIDSPVYASSALQEAIVNAVVHRDYELTGSQVRIFIFPYRMEFWNPGGLHNTLRVEDLYAGCQPIRRSQLLAGFLRDYASPVTGRSYMEARGEGFLTLVRDSERISGKRPEIKIQGQAVCLTIFARKISD